MSYGVLARWQAAGVRKAIKPGATRPSYRRSFYFEEGAGAGARETAAAGGPGLDLGSSMSATGGVERSGVVTAKFRR
jgi:hypothetical protein